MSFCLFSPHKVFSQSVEEKELRLARRRENYRLRQANISTEESQRQSQRRTEISQQRRARYIIKPPSILYELHFSSLNPEEVEFSREQNTLHRREARLSLTADEVERIRLEYKQQRQAARLR